MTIFEFRIDAHLPGRAFVKADERFEIAIERVPEGLEIRVYPVTDGEIWDDPYDTFTVDESAVEALEQAMGGQQL
jgi:hypothetical protein